MKKSYKHLNQFDRDRIEAMLSAGHKQKEIASVLGKNKTTISREIKRNRRKLRNPGGNKDGPYESSVANHKAYVRRKYAKFQGLKIESNKDLRVYIIYGLEQGWSPDEISGRMEQENKPFYASKDLIYAWLYSVWGQKYVKHLYSKRDRKKKRKLKKTEKVLIPNRVGIESRPTEVNQRKSYGHFEADTIVSGKSSTTKESLVVAIERKARYVDIRKIKSLSPIELNLGIKKILARFDQEKTKTLTLDNGIENQRHEELKTKFEIDTFFCEPYSSWQKGGVENANKLIRKYIPKGSDISEFSHQYVTVIVQKLNNKPRKSLGYKTPKEVMLEQNLLSKFSTGKVALRG